MIESINQEEEEVEEDMEEDDEDEENVDEENIGQLSKRVTFQTNSKSTSENGIKSDIPKFRAEGLMKLKKASKMREKKEKKDRRRRDKVATELSNNLENAFEAFGKTDKY